MKLRPYQEELINRVYQSWESGNKNVLLQLPTGGGKSILFSTIVMQKAFGADRLPTAIMVHRKELVQQISLTLSSLGIMHNIIAPKITITGIIAAQRKRYGKSFYDFKSHVSVISVDTLNSRILKHKDWVKSIKLWITDEAAHLLASNKWGKAVSYFNNCIGLGVTATPQRLDKKGLGSHADGVFDHMVVGPGSRWLIQNKYLSRYKIVAPESDIANYLAKPSDRADYTRENMAEAAGKSQIVGDVVTNYLKFAPGKQAILFATDINTAKKMEENFIDKGIPAKLLTGMSSDRERFEGIIDFEEKRTKVLVNVDLFDEGLDCPNIEVVIMARPTMSLGKYLQMCVDEETEILTDKGWTNYESISKAKKVAALNISSEEIEWCDIEEIYKRDRSIDETMYSYSAPHLNFRVTSMHDMVVKARRSPLWLKETIDESFKRKTMFKVPVSGSQKIKDVNLTDNEIKFLAWFLTDGSLRPYNKSKCVKIYQSVSNEDNVKKIRTLLDKLNFKYFENRIKRKGEMSRYSDMIHFTVPMVAPKRHFKNWADKKGWKNLEPWIDKDKKLNDLYDKLSSRQVEVLFKEMMLGDGYKRTSPSITWTSHTMSLTCGDNKQMADRLQEILIVRGFRCNQAVEKRGHLKRKDCYNLHVKKKNFSTIAGSNDKNGSILNKKSYVRNRITKELEYKKEIVWCVKNRLGTIITRRKGKVLIMGNCGRGLRPHSDKEYTLLIDHVGNVVRHGLPCSPRKWTLDRVERRKSNKSMIRICSNVDCAAPYERELKECPWCGTPAIVMERGGRVPPEMVDGDLTLIDPESLIEMNSLTQLEDPARLAERVAHVAGGIAGQRALKNQVQRIEVQKELAEIIARWAGEQKIDGLSDREIHKRYYLNFGETIAQSLSKPRSEMLEVVERLQQLTSNKEVQATARQMPMPSGLKPDL